MEKKENFKLDYENAEGIDHLQPRVARASRERG